MHKARLVSIDDVSQLDVCEKLQSEYIAWINMMLIQEYACSLSVKSANLIKSEIQTHWPMYSDQRGRFLLAFMGKRVAGMAGIKYAKSGVCELKRLYVLPTCRRLGLGRLMVGKLLAEASTLGYRMVRLETLDFMVEAIRLYESFGFARTIEFEGAEGRDYGIQGHEIYFVLNL
jgi:ribosomal protein S18 acetylase RimI-like enzyme